MKTITDLISRYDMLPPGSKVLCAVSGGADSMCLLHWLADNADALGISVSAAHFEHGIRGDESLRDMNFVEEACRAMQIPLFIGRGNVPEYAEERSMGLEEAARELRYEFLERTAGENGFDRIATAHNADDNAETVIFNLARGSGAAGICGIPPVRGKIVRPLLETCRSEIEKYLSDRGISHIEDSTNSSGQYSRNKIRHQIMPVLREINPSVSKAILRTGDMLREDNRLLEELADEFIAGHFNGESVRSKELAALPDAVEARVIRKLCPQPVSAVHTNDIMKLATGTELAFIDVPGARIRRQKGRIWFRDPPVPKNKKKKQAL
ncbi:MAG: tRNA lysidine(34) synthetase TilS [Oscillospiraceae bacterium]|nr:tRNA lysidine(34) synthetase TilS [Oscillospiraceae bacterium]